MAVALDASQDTVSSMAKQSESHIAQPQERVAAAAHPAGETPAADRGEAAVQGEPPCSGASREVMDALERYWGYDALRPLQREAIEAGLSSHDSLVVMPTGGGKSLCYQIPPLVAGRMDIVISPLISLMKDQVDGLRQNGYPAGAIHSGMSERERFEAREMVRTGECRLLFLTPERLLTERFLSFVRRQNVRCFAIDEAHCISQWGHDFRPEYRALRQLRDYFPEASIHAYTATATPRVQKDIVEQLGLRSPSVLIGTFDRPNLVYRIVPKVDVERQTLQIVRRHANEAVIVYCLSRKDTENLAEFLKLNGVKAAAYHAGLEKAERTHTQEAFAAEELDVVVATVAFGMGIDRSNVRCVVHAAIPKTIEHYQQETGRAGRDGLEAECVLLYSGADVMVWEKLIAKSAQGAKNPGEVIAAQRELLSHMQGLCSTLECRHRALSRYFGQRYPHDDCGACDVCLGEVEGMKNSTTVAQKILSCVYRVGQATGVNFGVGYINELLRGAKSQTVRSRGHENLSTFGLLKNLSEHTITNLIYQLVDQGLLDRTGGDRPVLQLNDDSLAVLRGEREVKLIEPGAGPVRKTKLAEVEWEGVDRGLFEHLRQLRHEIAQEQSVPAFVIFGDSTLRELARHRPTSLKHMASIHGVGERKLDAYGEAFTSAIEAYCVENNVNTDVEIVVRPARDRSGAVPRTNARKLQAFTMFAEGASIEEVAAATGRASSTISGYLIEWIRQEKPEDISAWVSDEEYDRIIDAAGRLGADRLRPVFDALNEEVSFDAIKAALTHYSIRLERHQE
jgi:ATP-dependent DNA helicase RecQ